MICIKVPEKFRQGNFNELIDSLCLLSGEGVELIYSEKTDLVIEEFRGTGWRICHTRFDIRDTLDWFIKFDQESLATAFTLKWMHND